MSWTLKRVSGKGKSKYYIVAGRAYPSVLEGKNPTNVVSSHPSDREAFYRDKAVVLSDENMDEFDGTEGAPLCVEHDLSDVVGKVHHAWLGDGDKRALKIIARVPTHDEQGRSIDRGIKCVADIQAGRYKGFSVGYGADITTGRKTGITKVEGKNFREISLVEDPFFEDCRLSHKVEASKKALTNLPYKSNEDVTYFYVPIQMSNAAPTDTTIAAPATQPPATPAPAISGDELIQQADRLKGRLDEVSKSEESTLAKMAEMQKALDYFTAKQKAEDEQYAIAQKPKFDAYVKDVLVAASKEPPSEAVLKSYERSFCDSRFKTAAAMLESQHRDVVELRASKAKADAELAQLKEEKAKMEAALSKTSSVILNHSRRDFASALQTKDAVLGSVTEEETKRKADIEASRKPLDLSYIACPMPSVAEMPFMEAHGFTGEVNVNASAFERYGGSRDYIRTVPVAASHRNLRDEDGDVQLPASMRYHSPHLFGWMCAQEGLREDDLSDIVNLNAAKNVIVRKDAEKWDGNNRNVNQVAANQ